MAQKIEKLRSRFRDSTQMIKECVCLSVCLSSSLAPSPALKDSPLLRTVVGLQLYKLGIQQKGFFLQSFGKVPGSSFTGPVTSPKVTLLRSDLNQTQDKTRPESEEGVIFPGQYKVRFSEEDGQGEDNAQGMKLRDESMYAHGFKEALGRPLQSQEPV